MKKLTSLLMAMALLALFAIPAIAQQDLDCRDFDTQEEAQEVFDQDTSDPNRLDADNDGFACEDLPSAGTEGGDVGEVNGQDEDAGDDMQEDATTDDQQMPNGMGNTGGGGMADAGSSIPVGAAAAALTMLTAGAYATIRRR